MGGATPNRSKDGIEARVFVSNGRRTTVALLIRSQRPRPVDATIVHEYPAAVDATAIHVGNTRWTRHEAGVVWQGVVRGARIQLCRYEIDLPDAVPLEDLFVPPRIADVTPTTDGDGPDTLVVADPVRGIEGRIRAEPEEKLERSTVEFESVRESTDDLEDVPDRSGYELLFGSDGDSVAFEDLVGEEMSEQETEPELELELDDSLEA